MSRPTLRVKRLLLRLSTLTLALALSPTSWADPGPDPARGPEIVYGGDAAFPPYEFLDDSGTPAGLNIDLIRAVARAQGLRVQIHLDRWTRIREGLARGEIDVAAMYRTPRRSREMDFAIAHELVYHELFVRRGSPAINALDGLAGKRVLVQGETYAAEALEEMGTCAAVLARPDELEALRGLARGEGDAAVVTQTVGRPFRERSRSVPDVVPTGPPVLLAEYAFAMRPGRREVLEQLNAGVAAVKDSGEYEAIYHRWLQPDRSAARARLVGWALLGATLVALLVAVWNASLRRRVAGQTQALREQFAEKERAQAALAATEQSLRSAQRLEALGRAAGGMAHDFNNLLSVLLSYGTALREQLAARGLDTADADEIVSASERGARLARQLLAFSRATPVAAERLDLGALLKDMRSLLERLVGEDIQLDVIAPEAPVIVEAETTQVEQIVLNLAANARDAMSAGGRLVLRLELRPVAGDGALADGDHACLSVTDTGVGMDAGTLAHLFEPFFTTKEVGRGTGLGLATVHAHVQRLRGKVTVESAPGQGTTFRVLLPLAKHREQGAAPHVVAPGPALDRRDVLLVEDDDALRRAAAQALQRAGHRVVEARDGEAALEAAREAWFSVLVTDVVMPRRSGPSLAAELRRRQPGLLVLYVSGYVRDGQPLDLDAPGTAFLPKPYAGPALVEAVGRLVARGVAGDDEARTLGGALHEPRP